MPRLLQAFGRWSTGRDARREHTDYHYPYGYRGELLVKRPHPRLWVGREDPRYGRRRPVILSRQTMADRQAGVSIISSSRAGDVATTELHLEEGSWGVDPMAPATVWRDDAGLVRLIDLHRLLDLDGPSATFESYGLATALPAPGGPHSFIPWWTHEQYEAAADPALEWEERQYYESDHTHCRLTWHEITPGELAYVSDAGWITVEAYERFIREDQLRIRSTPPPR